MTADAELRQVAYDDSEHQEIAAMVEMLRAASASHIARSADPIAAMSKLATASAMFAGTQLGALIVLGVAKDQDRRRFVESMARNVRSGIEVGKRRAARVARETAVGQA